MVEGWLETVAVTGLRGWVKHHPLLSWHCGWVGRGLRIQLLLLMHALCLQCGRCMLIMRTPLVIAMLLFLMIGAFRGPRQFNAAAPQNMHTTSQKSFSGQ